MICNKIIYKKINLFFIVTTFLSNFCFSQTVYNADSLVSILENCNSDTCRLRMYADFAEKLVFNNRELSIDYTSKAQTLLNSLKSSGKSHLSKLQKTELLLLHIKGVQHSVNALFDSAEVYFMKGMQLAKQIRSKKDEAGFYSDISEINRKRGNYPIAAEYAIHSLKLKEEIGDSLGMAISFNNLGMIFRLKKEYEKSLEYHFKAIALKKIELIKAPTDYAYSNLGYSFGNIANVYYGMEQYDKAISYCEEAVKLYKKGRNTSALGATLSNLGVMYEEEGNITKALAYYLEALALKEKTGNKEDLATSYINLGGLYSATDLNKGEKYLMKGYLIAKEARFKEFEKEGALALADLYSLKGEYKKAYDYHLIYSTLKDSILGEQSHLQITEMETKYETEKKDKENFVLKTKNEVQKLESAKKDAEIGKQRVIIGVSIFGIILVAGLALFIFKIYRDKKRANEIITQQKVVVEEQKHIIEEKQKELLDSIHYAKRIQRALIPSEKYIKTALNRMQSKK